MRSFMKVSAGTGAILQSRRAVTTLGCILAIICLTTSGTAQRVQKRAPGHPLHKKAVAPAAAPAPPPAEVPPPPPLPPPTLEQLPPGAPQVSWDGEQLTINSDNSTLADILTAVRRLTGADIDMPGGTSSERVAARLGPGPAREILSSLLSGTDFNYVIQATDNNPLGLQSILLTLRSKGTGVAGSKTAIVASMQRPESRRPPESTNVRGSEKTEASADTLPADKPSADSSAAEAHTASVTTPPTSADSKTTNGEPQATTSEPLPVQADLTPPPTTSDPAPDRPKTLDDKIQSMQSLFEQRRQMIEQARKPQATN